MCEVVHGQMIRLKNRRVWAGKCPDCKTVFLRWKMLLEGREIKVTKVSMTEEAAVATFQLLHMALEDNNDN